MLWIRNTGFFNKFLWYAVVYLMCSDEVSWPAGALEEQDYESGQQGDQQLQLTREQVEQEQELMEKQTQDRCIFLYLLTS
jgi:hypothetical protein